MIASLGTFLQQLGSNLGEFEIDSVTLGEGESAELAISPTAEGASGLSGVGVYLHDDGQALVFEANIVTDYDHTMYAVLLDAVNDANHEALLVPNFAVGFYDAEGDDNPPLCIRAHYVLCLPPLTGAKQGALLDWVRYSLEQFLIETERFYRALVEGVTDISIH